MADLKEQQRSRDVGRVLEIVVRLGLVAVIVAWVAQIIQPFISVVTWAAVIAVTLYPPFCKVARAFGGKSSLVAMLFAVLSVGLVVWSTVAIVEGSITQLLNLAAELRSGELSIPEPNDKLNDVPLIGRKLFGLWSDAARDLESTIVKFAEPLKTLGDRAFYGLLHAGQAAFMFVFSLLVASAFMAKGEAVARFMHKLAERLLGRRAEEFVKLATGTIRSVALGVLGVAFIQCTFAALGFVMMGIPFAGLWCVCVLFLAIVQLPTVLVMGPVAVYAFSTHQPTAATMFAIYLLMVSVSDNLLKPLLLGRGAQVPTLVILMGSIGGMMFAGIIGLFTGSVVLSVFYRLFGAWLYDNDNESES